MQKDNAGYGNANDELIREQPFDIPQLLQNQIKKLKYQKESNAYIMAYKLILTLGDNDE